MNTVKLVVEMDNPHDMGTDEFREYRNKILRENGFINLHNGVVYMLDQNRPALPNKVYYETGRGYIYYQHIEIDLLDPQIAMQLTLEGRIL
jgi:hypothetical protein